MADTGHRPVLAFTFDFEDWHQIIHRNLGAPDWDRPGPAFPRQIEIVLDLLDELDVRATFFVLGMCARLYPDSAAAVAARGHEIACHGFDHVAVSTKSLGQFRRDVELALEEIDRACGVRPAGYRAPAFSINRHVPWVFDALGDLGFTYDSSQYDSPRIADRLARIPHEPFILRLGTGKELVELPLAVARLGGRAFPVAGGSYWRALPWPVLARALTQATAAGGPATVYLHPYECDEFPLRADPSAAVGRQAAALRASLYWNVGRSRLVGKLRRLAETFELVTCEEVVARTAGRVGTRPRALSRDGVLV